VVDTSGIFFHQLSDELEQYTLDDNQPNYISFITDAENIAMKIMIVTPRNKNPSMTVD